MALGSMPLSAPTALPVSQLPSAQSSSRGLATIPLLQWQEGLLVPVHRSCGRDSTRRPGAFFYALAWPGCAVGWYPAAATDTHPPWRPLW